MGISKEEKKTIQKISKAVKLKVQTIKSEKAGTPPSYCLIRENKIIKLKLSGERPKQGKDLEGPRVEIPEEIGNLRDLETLQIENLILEGLPDSIGQLTKLRELILNRITVSHLPDAIGNFTKLEKFHLFFSQCQTLPDSIGNWTNVQEVLIQSSLTSKLPPTIKYWSNVQHVQLRNSKFEQIPLGICGWVNIKRLWMLGNPFMKGEDGKLVREAQTWGINGYSEIVDAGIPVLLRNLYPRFIEKYPEYIFEFQAHPEWQKYNVIYQDKKPYMAWQLQNYNNHALLGLGMIYQELERYEEATLFYKTILATENSHNAKIALMEINERNLPLEEKEILYTKRVATGGFLDTTTWKPKLAKIKFQLGKYTEALQIFQELLQKANTSEYYWYSSGECYMKMHDYAKAKQCFVKVLELIPKFGKSRYTVREIQELLARVS